MFLSCKVNNSFSRYNDFSCWKFCRCVGVTCQKSQYIGKIGYSMMALSNGNILRVTGLCKGNPPVTSGFPSQRPEKRSFNVFYDLRLNKRLSKPSIRWWLETPSRSLWRRCNGQTVSCLTKSVTLHGLSPMRKSMCCEWPYQICPTYTDVMPGMPGYRKSWYAGHAGSSAGRHWKLLYNLPYQVAVFFFIYIGVNVKSIILAMIYDIFVISSPFVWGS